MFDVLFGVQYGYTCDVCHEAIPNVCFNLIEINTNIFDFIIIILKGASRYHCWECKDFDVCLRCNSEKPHPHKFVSKEKGT